ncbi:MAG: DUF2207 domain-containing protein [Clostridia bacterium]|nr:DUF2207 domain-containing protein [Clostridia bacterium]
MKKVKKLPVFCIAALLLLLIASFIGVICSNRTASADTAPRDAYDFEISKYNVTYDVAADRKIAVTEDITIHYLGYSSTGFIRDIPVNAGEQVKNVSVRELINGREHLVYYNVNIDMEYRSYVSVDIGSSSLKTNETHTYRINYNYVLTKAQEGKNKLIINPIGFGWDYNIYDANATLLLPDGYKGATCYAGKKGTDDILNFTKSTENGRTVLKAHADNLEYFCGITFDIDFEDGILKTHTDFTPYWFIIVGAVLLAVVILLKLFVFNKSKLLPVVNYEAPDKMDPLMMGKLIDNKVNGEDVTSLIYYWADKGYLKINLDNRSNPVLIRIVQNLPENSANYERDMFNSLFASGDVVEINSLKYNFYPTVNRVTAQVNKQTKGLYNNVSIGISIIFAVLGGLLLGLTPLILGMVQISLTLLYYTPMIVLVPALIIYALTETIMYNKLKLSKKKLMLFSLGIAGLCLICGVFYVLFTPSSIIGLVPKILLWIVGCAVILCSVFIVSRSKDYNEKLGDIVGFRNFILLAEKDQLEAMLEEDPQFYYHVLPYAQVLGVTDKWEEKFKGLTVQPPQWVTGSVFTDVLSFHIMNNILRNSFSRISSNMISRPSSSGLSGGGFGGGSFGGFSGGGHGGGGGRGR